MLTLFRKRHFKVRSSTHLELISGESKVILLELNKPKGMDYSPCII